MRDVQPENENFPINVTEDGIKTSIKDVHPSKVCDLIAAIDEGIEICSIFLHLQNE